MKSACQIKSNEIVEVFAFLFLIFVRKAVFIEV